MATRKNPETTKSAVKSAKSGAKDPPNAFAGLRDLRDQLAKQEEEKAKVAKAPPPKPRAPPGNAAASAPTGSNTSSGDEELAFHRLMSGVTPLEEKSRRVARVATAEAAKLDRRNVQREPDTTMEHLRVLIDEGSKFEVVDDGRRVEGHRIDVPPDFVRRLRRGGFPVDGSLDLHGLSAAESRTALEAFLRDKRARGERCVLVVHGKGAHSPAGIGILRGEMSAWLSQASPSVHVAAFTTALDSDGGEGAVYVLLRR